MLLLHMQIRRYFNKICDNIYYIDLHICSRKGNNMLSALAKYVINRFIPGLYHIALGAEIKVSCI
jgi:hypothetical protein